MVLAHRTSEPSFVAKTAQSVVIADTIFTATAVLLQPITGVWLAFDLGWSLLEPWLLVSIGLYLFIGVCWLPVVVIQIWMRDEAQNCIAENRALSRRYYGLFRIWFALGIPAFSAIGVLLWLMLVRPPF